MAEQDPTDKRTGLEPELLAFLLCDDVIHDSVTGKRSIIGTFSTVYLEKVPGVYHRFAMYVALTEGRGLDYGRSLVEHVIEVGRPGTAGKDVTIEAIPSEWEPEVPPVLRSTVELPHKAGDVPLSYYAFVTDS